MVGGVGIIIILGIILLANIGCMNKVKPEFVCPDQILKENAESEFHCLNENVDGLICNREKFHYGNHYSVSLDKKCVMWSDVKIKY